MPNSTPPRGCSSTWPWTVFRGLLDFLGRPSSPKKRWFHPGRLRVSPVPQHHRPNYERAPGTRPLHAAQHGGFEPGRLGAVVPADDGGPAAGTMGWARRDRQLHPDQFRLGLRKPKNERLVQRSGLVRQHVNFTVFYEKGPWSGRVSHNFRDEFLDDIGVAWQPHPTVVEPYSQLDAAFSYALNDRLKFYAEAIKLTDENAYYYHRLGTAPRITSRPRSTPGSGSSSAYATSCRALLLPWWLARRLSRHQGNATQRNQRLARVLNQGGGTRQSRSSSGWPRLALEPP